MGYGLARDGISAEAALLHLKMGGIEAVCGALGFCPVLQYDAGVFKRTGPEPAETSHEAEENFIKCRLSDMASSFRKLSHIRRMRYRRKQSERREMARAFSELTETMCAPAAGGSTAGKKKNIMIPVAGLRSAEPVFRKGPGGKKAGAGRFPAAVYSSGWVLKGNKPGHADSQFKSELAEPAE